MIDCSNILSAVDRHGEVLVSACIQAEAAIHAARIQATAARQAGTMGLIAGLVAGVGALLAAGVAYWSVRSEARAAQKQDQMRQSSYRHHLLGMARWALRDLSTFRSLWKDAGIGSWKQAHAFLANNSGVVVFYDEISPDRRECYYIIEPNHLETVLRTRQSLRIFLYLVEEMEIFYQDHMSGKDNVFKDLKQPPVTRRERLNEHASGEFGKRAKIAEGMFDKVSGRLERFISELSHGGDTGQNGSTNVVDRVRAAVDSSATTGNADETFDRV